MGFINERKNILRAEDGPLVSVDKNGNEVQIGNGSISCDSFKCGETINFKFVDVDEALNAIFAGSASYFTASLVIDEQGGSQIGGALDGFYKTAIINNPFQPSFEIENIAVSGLMTPPVEQAGGLSYPTTAFSSEGVDSESGYQSTQFGLDVSFFQIKYSYERSIDFGLTPSFSYYHAISFADSYELTEGRIFIQVDTEEDLTGEVITGFTYSLEEAQYVPAGL